LILLEVTSEILRRFNIYRLGALVSTGEKNDQHRTPAPWLRAGKGSARHSHRGGTILRTVDITGSKELSVARAMLLSSAGM
jgi:hypothetical protein